MNIILKRIGNIRLTPYRFFGFWIALFAIMFALTSCENDLDVQQSYPFTVDVMPYGDKISKGQTIELRLEIKSEGNYTNTMYTIRYFQYEGDGTLKLVDGPVLTNNDRVLPGEPYRKGCQLTEAQADLLLRKDLRKFCAMYKDYGKDSVLLGALAYNIGPGAINKSTVLRLLKSGNRNIFRAYTSHCHYHGKWHKGLHTRRLTELGALYVP